MNKMSLQEIESKLDFIEGLEDMWELRLDIPFAGRALGNIRTDDEIKAELKRLDEEWESVLALM